MRVIFSAVTRSMAALAFVLHFFNRLDASFTNWRYPSKNPLAGSVLILLQALSARPHMAVEP